MKFGRFRSRDFRNDCGTILTIILCCLIKKFCREMAIELIMSQKMMCVSFISFDPVRDYIIERNVTG